MKRFTSPHPAQLLLAVGLLAATVYFTFTGLDKDVKKGLDLSSLRAVEGAKESSDLVSKESIAVKTWKKHHTTERPDEASTNESAAKQNSTQDDATILENLGQITERGKNEKKRKKTTVRQISIIGERNSGTTWTAAHIEKCFGHMIAVQDKLVRYKHWFQHDIVEKKRIRNTLVVAQFRNPYHWVKAMKAKPHHAPMHNTRDWRTFVTTPWTMPRTERDLELLRQNGTVKEDDRASVDGSNIPCKAYYKYHQINSCANHPFPESDERYKGYFNEGKEPKFSGYKPSYELRNDGSGVPYGSVVDLRADKIRNFLEIAEWEWVEDLKVVRYEDLVKNGTEFLIRYIEEVTGIKSECDVYPPQDRPARSLPPKFVEWMNDFVDWDAENLIGYAPLKPDGRLR